MRFRCDEPSLPVSDAELRALILAALDSADPAGTLADRWPWLPPHACREFAAVAVPLARARGQATREVLAARNAGLDELVERFAHTVRAERADAPTLSLHARAVAALSRGRAAVRYFLSRVTR